MMGAQEGMAEVEGEKEGYKIAHKCKTKKYVKEFGVSSLGGCVHGLRLIGEGRGKGGRKIKKN